MVRQTLEGTWEEVSQHATELAGCRVRLIVLEDAGTTPLSEQTMDKLFVDYIGLANSQPPLNLARRSKEAFGDIVNEKYRKRIERA